MHADEFPKYQLGTWCVHDNRGVPITSQEDRELCLEEEPAGSILELKRDRFDWIGGPIEDKACRIKSVKRTKTKYALFTKPETPDDWNTVTRIRVRCRTSAE